MDEPLYTAEMSDQELREKRDAADGQVQRHRQMGDVEMTHWWENKAEQFNVELRRRSK